MMSTALVMAVGGEQTKMRSATSDRVESGETTFAQSFGEHVGSSVDLQTMSSAGDSLSEMRGGKSSDLLKSPDALPAASAGAKANAVVDQRLSAANAIKSVAGTVANSTGKSVAENADLEAFENAAGRGRSKADPVQLSADRCELQQNIGAKIVVQAGVSQTKTTDASAATGNEELPAGDAKSIETSTIATNNLFAAESATVDAVPRESTILADRSLLPRDGVEPTSQNETVLAGKTQDVASAKKEAKNQAAEAKAASKATGTTESSKTVEDASHVTGMEGAIPLQVASLSDAQPNAVGVTATNASSVLSEIAGTRATGSSTAGKDNAGRKAVVTGKDDVSTTGPGVDSTASTTVVMGFGAEIDKAAAVTLAAGKDADAKGLSAVGTAALVHSATGNEAVASGIVTGIMSGHAQAEIGGTKVQVGGVGAYATTSPAGLMEQDGSGVAAAETGMSHRTLLATPTTLEVGLANGSQGWLKIRAEMTDGGVVNASLSSATSAGQEMLHRELPALTAYLQEERVAVNTVVVPASPAAGADSRFAGGMNGEGSGQTQQGSRQGGADDRQGLIHASADRADEVPTFMGLNGVGDDGLLSAGTYAGGGSWLNVRA
jgi:hypothetical protein